MRIAVFAGCYYPTIGGYIKNIHELTKRLAMMEYEVTVITCTCTEKPLEEMLEGVRVVKLPSWNLGTVLLPKPTLCLLRWFFRKPEFDVTVTQTRFFPTSVLGTLWAMWHKIPYIHVERGSQHSATGNWITTKLGELFDHTLGRWVIKSARMCVGVSNAACKFVVHLGGRNTRTRIIYNGIEIPDARQREHKKNEKKRITFVGRLVWAKGVQDLLEAFSLLPDNDDTELVVVGDGDYRDELQRLADLSLRREQIRFLGELNHEQISEVLKGTDVFVNPSYSEGLPTSVMEALAARVAVIATDVGGTRELILHGHTGLLVNPHNVGDLTTMLEWMLANPAQARQMASQGRKLMQAEYSWGKITEQWIKLLEEVKIESQNTRDRS